MEPATDGFFNTEQAARTYNLSASWLAKLRMTGGGSPYLKAGRRVLYRRSVFEAWLAGLTRQSTSDTGASETVHPEREAA